MGTIPTQKEVVAILGVQNSAVSKWERGVNKPRADKLPQLAKLYDCTVDELIREDEENEDSVDSTAFSNGRTRETG